MNQKGINVLSLFDGMSCGQQALERQGILVDNYFASEIDKHAIAVTMHNYPNTKQLGSVVDVNGHDLPKIDLLIGGSPCQSFSFAGKRKGMATKCETEILTLQHYLELKAEGYEFEGQSYLFWEFMRLLDEVKPKYFLLENVEMGEKWERVLSKAIGVNGIHINSALVSAQNRKRIYWTNIGMQPGGLFGDMVSMIQQPKDKGILLKDVLQTEVDEKYYLSEKAISSIILNKDNLQKSNVNPTKSNTLQSPGNACGTYKGASYIVHNTMPRSSKTGKGGTGPLSRTDGKTYCLDTGNTNAVEIKDYGNKRLNDNIKKHQNELQHGILLDSYNQQIHKDKSIAISTRIKDSNLTHIYDCYNGKFRTDEKCGSITQHCSRNGMTNGFKVIVPNNDVEIQRLNENQKKKFDLNPNTDKASCLTLAQGRAGSSDEYMDSVSKIAKIQGKIRRLTPVECERLQTVKDNYTAIVSDTQRYRMLGNGWTVDVIAHIFSYAKFY
jgi:DNA (cytosine-5)-methyltransferase 3A